MLFKNYRNAIAIAALGFTAWASLATSSPTKSIDNNDLYVISDCVSPTFERQVRSAGGSLISGVDYTQIGFPTSTVHLGADSYGITSNGVTNVSRLCTETYGNNGTGGDGKYIYSCLDNGEFVCSIVIIQL